MRSKIFGTTLVLIGLVLGGFLVNALIMLPDDLIVYRERLATGFLPYNAPSPEEWLQAALIGPIVFLVLSLLLVIAGCLVALRARYASSVCLGTGLYAAISYVLEGWRGVDIALLILILLVLLGLSALVSTKPVA